MRKKKSKLWLALSALAGALITILGFACSGCVSSQPREYGTPIVDYKDNIPSDTTQNQVPE
ncbi:MAG: hypothetical protein K5893_01695 [Prevotella sp.]|nr:hypothetical protein [Prevotella sp.]